MIGFIRNCAKPPLKAVFDYGEKNAFKSRGADGKTVNYGCRKR